MAYLLVGLMTGTGVIFALSVLSKVSSPARWREFVASLHDLRLLRKHAVRTVALAVVVGEAAVALVALIGLGLAIVRRPVAPLAAVTFGLATAMLVVLTAGIVLALRRGSTARCACFGPGQRLDRLHVARNALVLLAVVAGLVGAAVDVAVMDVAVPDPAGVLVSLGAGAVVGLCVTRTEDLVELFAAGRPRI